MTLRQLPAFGPCAEEMPGVAVLLQAAAAVGDVGKHDGHAGTDSGDGDDVPGVLGDNVAGDEITIAASVAAVIGALGVQVVGIVDPGPAGFHLHAGDPVAGGEDQEIEAVVVPKGTADGKSQADGAGHEGALGVLALGLAVAEMHSAESRVQSPECKVVASR